MTCICFPTIQSNGKYTLIRTMDKQFCKTRLEQTFKIPSRILPKKKISSRKTRPKNQSPITRRTFGLLFKVSIFTPTSPSPEYYVCGYLCTPQELILVHQNQVTLGPESKGPKVGLKLGIRWIIKKKKRDRLKIVNQEYGGHIVICTEIDQQTCSKIQFQTCPTTVDPALHEIFNWAHLRALIRFLRISSFSQFLKPANCYTRSLISLANTGPKANCRFL